MIIYNPVSIQIKWHGLSSVSQVEGYKFERRIEFYVITAVWIKGTQALPFLLYLQLYSALKAFFKHFKTSLTILPFIKQRTFLTLPFLPVSVLS